MGPHMLVVYTAESSRGKISVFQPQVANKDYHVSVAPGLWTRMTFLCFFKSAVVPVAVLRTSRGAISRVRFVRDKLPGRHKVFIRKQLDHNSPFSSSTRVLISIHVAPSFLRALKYTVSPVVNQFEFTETSALQESSRRVHRERSLSKLAYHPAPPLSSSVHVYALKSGPTPLNLSAS